MSSDLVLFEEWQGGVPGSACSVRLWGAGEISKLQAKGFAIAWQNSAPPTSISA